MSIIDGTTEFHTKSELPTGEWVVADEITYNGHRPMTAQGYEALRALRRNLMREEVREYFDAEEADDLTEIVDGLLDMIVIAWGTLLAYVGEDVARIAAEEVVRSNLSKVDGSLGPIVRREDGKILKPEGWTPPDIVGVLGLHEEALRRLGLGL